MRPARKGPENRSGALLLRAPRRAGFNEAGPQGAGKPRAGVLRGDLLLALQ